MNTERNMRLKTSIAMLCLFLFASIISLREVTGQGESHLRSSITV
jgi:hypothetical protein